jgi:hypothetical protein
LFTWGYEIAVWLVSRPGPFGMTEKRSDRIGRPIGPRNQRRPLAYWASVMVVIGLGREVGAVSYGLVSRLLGGAGTVQVGSGSA